MGQLLHDVQPQAAAGAVFIEPLAALKNLAALLGIGNSGAIVINADLQLLLQRLHADADLLVRPFARVVQQIAQHFEQVLLFTLEGQLRGVVLLRKVDMRIQPRHGAQQGLQGLLHRCAQAGRTHGGGCACAGEVVVHLTLGGGDLFAHQQGQG